MIVLPLPNAFTLYPARLPTVKTRIRKSLLAVLGFLLIGVPVDLAGQAAVRVVGFEPGTRVRVSAPGILEGRYQGPVLGMRGDTLLLPVENRDVGVPLPTITRLEISRGRDRMVGALIGGVVGVAVLGGTGLVVDRTSCTDYCFAGIAGAVVGAPAGALVGALIGRERWERLWLGDR